MRLPRYFWLTPLVLLTAIAIACGGDDAPPPSDVVASIPWQADETAEYVLKNDRGEEFGRATLRQIFANDTNRDDVSVVVDSTTLKPSSSRREITGPNETETIESEYTEEGVLIRQGERQSGLSVPEHAYDNDSSLFLWRTIAFAPENEASYVTIITNYRSRHDVVLRVRGVETISVGGREYQAWRLEIETSNAKQTAWHADTPARTLLKYDNDRDTIFELRP